MNSPRSATHPPVPARPSGVIRLKVAGHLLIWLAEGLVQVAQLGLFLCRRAAHRRHFAQLICRQPSAARTEWGRFLLVGALLLGVGPTVGCRSLSTREATTAGNTDSLRIRSEFYPLVLTWEHLAAGRTSSAHLRETWLHLERGQGLEETADTFRHLRGGVGGLSVAAGTFVDLFIGPFNFDDLSSTLRHLD